MRFPFGDVRRRPGLLIPVFFLSSAAGLTQDPGFLDAGCAALGGCYTCLSGGALASLNQAGLANIEYPSIYLNHSRPFTSPELGVTNLGLQGRLGNGGLGLSLSSMGIEGMRQSSVWIACGLRAGLSLSVGAGIHLQVTGIRGEIFHRMGTGCAMGMLYELKKGLVLACHISLPLYRTRGGDLPPEAIDMVCGLRYRFFNAAAIHLELQGNTRSSLQGRGGLEIFLDKEASFNLGLGNNPFYLSSGVRLCPWGFPLVLSVQWCPDSGFHPSTLLGYEW